MCRFVLPEQATFNPVAIDSQPDYFSVNITEASGLYHQQCFVNRRSDDAGVDLPGTTLGAWNTKCNVDILGLRCVCGFFF